MSAGLSPWVGVVGLFIVVMAHTTGFAFWLGRLSQRMSTVEKATDGGAALNNIVIELKVKVEHMEGSMEKMSREMEGVNRQLGNIAMGHIGRAVELPGSKT
jgi:hypothetical protein